MRAPRTFSLKEFGPVFLLSGVKVFLIKKPKDELLRSRNRIVNTFQFKLFVEKILKPSNTKISQTSTLGKDLEYFVLCFIKKYESSL